MGDIYSILFLPMYVSTYRTLIWSVVILFQTFLAQGQICKDVNENRFKDNKH